MLSIISNTIFVTTTNPKDKISTDDDDTIRLQNTFTEYLEVVNDAINETSPECLGNIQEGFELMQELISTEAGASSLLQVFR